MPGATASGFYSQTLAATDGSDSGYSFSLASGYLPPGLSLSGDGTISGNVTNGLDNGAYTFTVVASDGLGASDSQSFTMNVIDGGYSGN